MRGVGYLFRAELLEAQRDPLMKIRVRSIFTKIVVWAVATVVISLVGFVVTSAFVSARISGRNANSPRLSTMFLDDARRAFQEGGPERLDAFLKRLNDYTDAEHFLTDGRGIDLVTGEDRSALRPSGASAYRSPLGRLLAQDRNDSPHPPRRATASFA